MTSMKAQRKEQIDVFLSYSRTKDPIIILLLELMIGFLVLLRCYAYRERGLYTRLSHVLLSVNRR
jgi:hypothetical protein